MVRPLRPTFPGAVYHLTTRGNARPKIFFIDDDRDLFLRTLSSVIRRYDWTCHAYCLMPNDYHLLVETPRPNLSIGMRLVERDSHLLELPEQIADTLPELFSGLRSNCARTHSTVRNSGTGGCKATLGMN